MIQTVHPAGCGLKKRLLNNIVKNNKNNKNVKFEGKIAGSNVASIL